MSFGFLFCKGEKKIGGSYNKSVKHEEFVKNEQTKEKQREIIEKYMKNFK